MCLPAPSPISSPCSPSLDQINFLQRDIRFSAKKFEIKFWRFNEQDITAHQAAVTKVHVEESVPCFYVSDNINDLHLQASFGEVAEQNDGRDEGAGICRLGGDDGCG